MLLFVLAESEFGFVLRGDFSSQWRSLQGADFYNGSGLGHWLNTLNYKQIYGIHIVVIPLLIIGLLFLHYLLVRTLGIAKPYRKDVVAKTVPADHKLLFARGGGLILLVLVLAYLLPSPFLKPTTIKEIANSDPSLMATTLIKEFDGSSDTAVYKDNIAPYTFSTREVYIFNPYSQLLGLQSSNTQNQVLLFQHESLVSQTQQLKAATSYFTNWDGKSSINSNNSVINIVDSLIAMAKSGLYESTLSASNDSSVQGDSTTYTLRFLSDSGVLEDRASALNLTTNQYGMLHEEAGRVPGAWWLAPIGLLNHSVLANDSNGDRDASIIFGSLFLLLLAFPFIPFVNQLPDKLKVYKIIWRDKK
jgi:hypothetical protein